MDDCLESQRCLNTPGSYKCIRTLSCGTGLFVLRGELSIVILGYAMDSETEQCVGKYSTLRGWLVGWLTKAVLFIVNIKTVQ